MRIRPTAVALCLVLLAGWPAGAVEREAADTDFARLADQAKTLHAKGRYLDAVKAYRLALTHRDDPKTTQNLATLLMSIWRYDDAEILLRRVLKAQPRNADALVWLSRCDIQKPDYVHAFRCLKAALVVDPASANAYGMLGFLLLRLDLYDWADRAFARAGEIDDRNNLARLGLAYMHRLAKRYRPAAVILFALIKENPLNISAYQELGMTLSSLDRTSDGLRVLERAIAKNPHMPGLHSSRGFLLFKLNDVPRSVQAYRRALAIDPDYRGGHGIYSFFKAQSAPNTGRSRLACRRGRSRLDRGAYSEAEPFFREALALNPNHFHSWLGLGACRFAAQDGEGVLAAARGTLQSRPDSPLGHNLFLQGLDLIDEARKAEISTMNYYHVFSKLPVPEVEGVEKVFTNFFSLSDDGRKVVLLAVHPLRKFLPVLLKKKVTHVILPLNRHLTDVGGMRKWKGKKTKDGRCYDAVRGVAGRGGLKLAVTGVENLWTSTYMGFNTLAHEFAHQVHIYALNGAQKTVIKNLYQDAKKHNRFLDYYSRTDVWEYFAQGFEAYVSVAKRPSVSEAAKNTRDDLRGKDPRLFTFILSLIQE
jgi:tetratricopeptide (TPR) repeat protein